jgi:site-specific recombinase XerD
MKKAKGSPLFFSMTWDFLEEYLPNRVGRSPETVESYRDSLTLFRRFLGEHKRVSIAKFKFSDCTKDCVFDFRDYLINSGSKSSTVNIRLTAIRSYLNYAADKDISVQSIAFSISQIPACKKIHNEKMIIGENALAAILSAPPHTKMGLRDRTILVMLYDSAVRLNELLSVRLCDISLAGEFPNILFHGKGSKERRVEITQLTLGHLNEYMRVFHPNSPYDTYLFATTIKGVTDKMSPSNVQRMIKQYTQKIREENPELNIPDSVHPHMFRRTRATNLYQDGVAIELVSAILGHEHIQTTKIYAKPSVAQLRAAQDAVPTPAQDEAPLWAGNEEEMARRCGLR